MKTSKNKQTSGRSRKTKKRSSAGILISLILVASVAGVILLFHHALQKDFSKAQAYLDSRSSQDVIAVEKAMAKRQRENLLQEMQQEDWSPFGFFNTSVILGDSRAKGFAEFGFVPENRVLAGIGDQVYKAADYTQAVSDLQPQTIFISYGINDIESNVGNAAGETGYGNLVGSLIEPIADANPDAQIAINSIIDIADGAQQGLLDHESIVEYNRQLQEICNQMGWIYIDNSSLPAEDYYSADGVHFDEAFYPIWAKNMVKTVVEASGDGQ